MRWHCHDRAFLFLMFAARVGVSRLLGTTLPPLLALPRATRSHIRGVLLVILRQPIATGGNEAGEDATITTPIAVEDDIYTQIPDSQDGQLPATLAGDTPGLVFDDVYEEVNEKLPRGGAPATSAAADARPPLVPRGLKPGGNSAATTTAPVAAVASADAVDIELGDNVYANPDEILPVLTTQPLAAAQSTAVAAVTVVHSPDALYEVMIAPMPDSFTADPVLQIDASIGVGQPVYGVVSDSPELEPSPADEELVYDDQPTAESEPQAMPQSNAHDEVESFVSGSPGDIICPLLPSW